MRTQRSPNDRPRITQGWMPFFDTNTLYMYIYIVYIQFLLYFFHLHMSKKSSTFAAAKVFEYGYFDYSTAV